MGALLSGVFRRGGVARRPCAWNERGGWLRGGGAGLADLRQTDRVRGLRISDREANVACRVAADSQRGGGRRRHLRRLPLRRSLHVGRTGSDRGRRNTVLVARTLHRTVMKTQESLRGCCLPPNSCRDGDGGRGFGPTAMG